MKSFKIFSVVILFAFHSHAQNFDINLLNDINSPPSPKADKNWNFISNTVAPISIATPLTMFLTGLSKNDQELKVKSYQAGAAFLASTLLANGLKIVIKRPRPFETYPDIIYKKGKGGGYSFPSGHTTTAFATATSLSMAFPKWYVIIPSYSYALAVGYSRMYLGVHYPTDVIAGMLLGIGTSFVMFKADKFFNKL
jgi:membrane-associated phospholipid phosphatase